MKIELNKNKVYFNNGSLKKEIHPFWLRERVDGEEFLDKGTQQRLFDPTSLDSEILINRAYINDEFLEIDFNDGVNSKLNINKLALEFSNEDIIIKSIPKTKWDSTLKNIKNYEYQDNFFESKEMHDLLVSFYKYGFVIIKNIPTNNNFIVKFANSIGSVRKTNFGEYFDVKSKPNPNDLAYTSLNLSPHTDNPYRNPVPCIQLLHCIENEVSGGLSTLVDGFTVTEDLKNENLKFYKILCDVKVRFRFIDKEVVLEDWSELIKLNDDKTFKQVRFSPRMDYVPILDKEKLDLYYKARKKLSEMYNSKKYKIEFKLVSKDLMMIDNYRLLHGRTAYETKEGNRFLQGCYIDYDSTEGKLRHLKRKFNL
ncbi:MAG: gamma-butyrobetaine,2-oxoglutarate dioxygenase [Flavobacteriaceae bacterium]|nr:gamma-butyrobetaine,2-oxoglutarate dioxygenase [Flavobacteriaceae bacterium]MDB3983043.1 TauD/TfdA family dioxygenase [Candidatus Pelagibacter sp.]